MFWSGILNCRNTLDCGTHYPILLPFPSHSCKCCSFFNFVLFTIFHCTLMRLKFYTLRCDCNHPFLFFLKVNSVRVYFFVVHLCIKCRNSDMHNMAALIQTRFMRREMVFYTKSLLCAPNRIFWTLTLITIFL